MAESFTNSLTRSAGIVTTSTSGSIGAGVTIITGISTDNIAVGDMVDTTHFRGGTKVAFIGSGQVSLDKTSTNSTIATSQDVTFMGVTTAFTASSKSILVGGTFANLTNNSINIYVEVGVGNTFVNIANDIPVPTGSSFVISDAGKTILRSNEEVRVYCNTENAVDVNLSVLAGVA
jgi:hypothetical protein